MAAAYAALLGKVERCRQGRGDQGPGGLDRQSQSRLPFRSRRHERLPEEPLRRRTSRTSGVRRGTYPFISEQSLIKRASSARSTWSYDLVYPRFDGANVDFAAVNARFADAAKKKAAESTTRRPMTARARAAMVPTSRASPSSGRPADRSSTIVVALRRYRGGAHGYGATHCTLVDLRTGKVVAPQAVFTPGEQWLRVMSQIVGADLKKQFVDKPGFDDALEPANLAKLLSEVRTAIAGPASSSKSSSTPTMSGLMRPARTRSNISLRQAETDPARRWSDRR